MPTAILTKWGNSIGIRIPSTIMKEAHLALGEELTITVNKKGVLTLVPVQKDQADWTAKFNAIADASSEEQSLIDVPNAFDEDEWTW